MKQRMNSILKAKNNLPGTRTYKERKQKIVERKMYKGTKENVFKIFQK